MTRGHDKKGSRVSEPVQVYLDSQDRARLQRLTDEMGATKSDVLRQALEVLEAQITNPDSNPALRIIGLAAGYPRRRAAGDDVATHHDRYLAEEEAESWKKPQPRKRGR